VAATTFLSGVIGGGASWLGKGHTIESLAKKLEEDEFLTPYSAPKESTVGAAQVNKQTLEENTLKGALGLEKALSFQDPVLRTLNSPSNVTRQASEGLAETYLYKNKNENFTASQVSVENMIKSYDLQKYKFFQEHDQLFLKYRKNTASNESIGKFVEKTKDVLGRSRADGKLTYHEFGEQVIKAARRGDAHDIPEVAEAAKSLRRNVFDPIYTRGKDAGLFGDDLPQVSTAPSYVTRLWDRFRIEGDLPRFKEINAAWMRQRRDMAAMELRTLEKTDEISEKVAMLEKRAGLLDEEIGGIVDELVDRILGTPAGRLPYETTMREEGSGFKGAKTVGKRGSAKERVYDIPDELVEDFLTNDVDAVVESYTRSLAADTELMKKFGSLDLENIYKDIQADYSKLMNGADAKTQRTLQKQKENDLRDMKAMVERLRGIYALPDDYAKFLPTAERTAMNWNYITLLGGMTISAFTDVARPVMAHGISRVYGDGIRAMAKNFKTFKAAAEEVKESGTALDMVLNTRARAQAGMDEYMPFTNRFSNAVGAMANNFGVISLMSPWNASMKQFTGVITQSRFIRSTTKFAKTGKIDAAEKTNLAANFIDRDMAKRIAAQFEKHGQEIDGIIVPSARIWDDIEARDIFRAAIRREVDGIIVTPGQDKPLWMSRPGWRLLGQFKSFGFASVQRTMLSGLQRRDMETMNGAALSVFLGMGVYAMKEGNAGRDLSDDWRVWVTEGIDRSGLTGWAFDVNNITEKISRGRVGVNALVGGPPMSRYASRSALEALFGPTYGQMGNATQAVGSAFSGEWRASDTAAVRKLMPYQNLVYLRKIFDDAENGVNDALGIKGKQK
jgi:hypothetical protein